MMTNAIQTATQRSLSTTWLKLGGALLLTLSLFELTGCSSRPIARAPVEDRSGASGQLTPVESKPVPTYSTGNQAFAGKPGYYTVKPGDTLYQVGRSTGQSAKDIIRWNNMDNPNQIEVGQVLRVAPPEGGSYAAGGASATGVPRSSSVVTTPIGSAASVPAEDEITWVWPSNGALIAGFDEVKNKGLKIAGKSGDPVYAAGDGRVVHAGPYLKYGNLIIIKHNETYLTAYAHNSALLVKQDQTVRKGQRIADMGSSDADRVMLHFELRRQGKPLDPAKYLPPR